MNKDIKGMFKSVKFNGELNSDTKWIYGKIKNNDYYGFGIYTYINGKQYGMIYPVIEKLKNKDDNNFNSYLNFCFRQFLESYKATIK